jgi:hypothetical protein
MYKMSVIGHFFLYSILHGPTSCNIEYGQWLAVYVVKLDMDRGWHGGW